jgi:hypothetical protein
VTHGRSVARSDGVELELAVLRGRVAMVEAELVAGQELLELPQGHGRDRLPPVTERADNRQQRGPAGPDNLGVSAAGSRSRGAGPATRGGSS